VGEQEVAREPTQEEGLLDIFLTKVCVCWLCIVMVDMTFKDGNALKVTYLNYIKQFRNDSSYPSEEPWSTLSLHLVPIPLHLYKCTLLAITILANP